MRSASELAPAGFGADAGSVSVSRDQKNFRFPTFHHRLVHHTKGLDHVFHDFIGLRSRHLQTLDGFSLNVRAFLQSGNREMAPKNQPSCRRRTECIWQLIIVGDDLPI